MNTQTIVSSADASLPSIDHKNPASEDTLGGGNPSPPCAQLGKQNVLTVPRSF